MHFLPYKQLSAYNSLVIFFSVTTLINCLYFILRVPYLISSTFFNKKPSYSAHKYLFSFFSILTCCIERKKIKWAIIDSICFMGLTKWGGKWKGLLPSINPELESVIFFNYDAIKIYNLHNRITQIHVFIKYFYLYKK